MMMAFIRDHNLFRSDYLSSFVSIFAAFFAVMIVVYSSAYLKGRKGLLGYCLLVLATLLCSFGAIYANHLVVFLVFWGLLGPLLYLLIGYGDKERTPATAKKALIIVGGTDAFMVLGLALIWKLAHEMRMDQLSIALTSKSAVVAYLCLMFGAFAKSGAMPFHNWVPDTAEDAPTPVAAYLPASLDKLLGIYFLTRISLDVFQLHFQMNTFVMMMGSITIVAAVMMALVQHDLKRLLGYHAVSQVGYMVLGIGTGNPIGIAGGLFHMLNNAIYKSCLFMSGGAVEKTAGTTNLEKLGGLAKVMPFTFVAFLVASLSISGVPPFNGFASKWMIYQGVIETGKTGSVLWIVFLVSAMFGSALTLASFMKLIHAIFLGQPSPALENKPREASFAILLTTGTLAFLCVLFGVFAYQIPLKWFVLPSIGGLVEFQGVWNASLATFLILCAILVGLVIYGLGRAAKTRESDAFVGGEILSDHPDMRLSGTEFYATIQDIPLLKRIYRLAQEKYFDLYEVGTKVALRIAGALRDLHNGVLPTYLAWCLLGALFLFYWFLK